MSAEFHPRWYRERVSTYWWLGRWPYTRFILRELTSLFVAWTVVLTLLLLRALAEGPYELAALQEWLRTPPLLALNGVSLLFVLYHTITWFNLAPSAMAVRVRGKRVPDVLIAAPNYVAWVAVTAAVAWFLLHQ
ncbi:MAG: fumarate reductase subunit C [Acidobacteria bacterium]|nr:fumarate reductase subunit C [Acidobacteriota bacterium]